MGIRARTRIKPARFCCKRCERSVLCLRRAALRQGSVYRRNAACFRAGAHPNLPELRRHFCSRHDAAHEIHRFRVEGRVSIAEYHDASCFGANTASS